MRSGDRRGPTPVDEPVASVPASSTAFCSVLLATTMLRGLSLGETGHGRRNSRSRPRADHEDIGIAEATLAALLNEFDGGVENEVVPRAMAVSDRTRLPVSRAWRKSSPSTGPPRTFGGALPGALDLAEHLALTGTTDSRPEATENKCVGTSSSKRTVASSSTRSALSPARSARPRFRGRRRGTGRRRRRPRSAGRWRAPPTRRGSPDPATRLRPWRGPVSRSLVTRSRTCSGVCECSSPTTTTDKRGSSYRSRAWRTGYRVPVPNDDGGRLAVHLGIQLRGAVAGAPVSGGDVRQ